MIMAYLDELVLLRGFPQSVGTNPTLMPNVGEIRVSVASAEHRQNTLNSSESNMKHQEACD